jgi:LysM repeat protein
MCLTKGVHMSTISSLIDWTVDDIKTVNPIYKAQYIPFTQPNQCITGPLTKIGKLVSLEDSLYKLENSLYGSAGKLTPLPVDNIIDSNEVAVVEVPSKSNNKEFIYHKVKSGETLSSIARKYNVTNSQITKLNRLRSSRVTRGQNLKIPQKTTIVAPPIITPPVIKDSLTLTMGTVYYDSSVTVYHVVQRNESLTVIAEKYNTTVEKIRELNSLKDNWLNIGQKLKVNTVLKLSKSGLVKTDVIKTEPKPITPKPVLPKPAAKKYYTVKAGDLFGRIAEKQGLTKEQLQKLNPGIKPDRINVGQELRIK